MPEHPFAAYIRILGKGPRLSRPLTTDEARAAGGMILRGEVEPLQLGAFLCLLRVKLETPEELAGLAMAVRDVVPLPVPLPPVDLDWPSYAGKSRRAPLFLLSALLLAQNGVTVAMHGTEGHTAGRLYSRDTLAALGIPAAQSLEDACGQLERRRFTYVPMELFHPRLADIMALKALLGLRSPLHSVIRHLNPFDAKASLISVFHPNYRAVHRDAAQLLGLANLACFKGDGGEVERRPEKPCLVEGLRDGIAFSEEWPVLSAAGGDETPLDPAFLAALWRGDHTDSAAETTVAATAAVALRLTGRAASVAEADALGRHLWDRRRRDSMAA